MPKFTKEIFLNTHRSYQLKSQDIDSLILHYWNKGIKIIKNGQLHPELIEEKRKKRLKEVAPLIERLQDPQTKYAAYLQLNFLSPNKTKQNGLCISNISPPFSKQYHAITYSIKDFILPNGQLKNLSNNDITHLNKICEHHYKTLLDRQIEYNIQALLDVCLEKFELKQEVEAIRKTLKTGEKVGYIFTNNTQQTKEHIECLILTQQAIIKPITWNYFLNSGISPHSQLLDTDFLGIPLYTPDLSYFNNENNPIKHLPHPQADQTSCGSLCFSFLKKLLGHNASELTSLTHTFSFYDHNYEKKYFFLPSPSILLYSQSSKYIDFLRKIMEETNQTVYQENRESAPKLIWTLRGLLDHSIDYAITIKDSEMFCQNIKLLNKLQSLRPRWLEASQQAIEERKQMDDPNSNKNLYLMYRTKKLENITFFSHSQKNKLSSEKQTDIEQFNYRY